jgi:hypothetical protein
MKYLCIRYGAKDYYDSCCYGHYENDQLMDFVSGDRDSGMGLTNAEQLQQTDPSSMLTFFDCYCFALLIRILQAWAIE